MAILPIKPTAVAATAFELSLGPQSGNILELRGDEEWVNSDHASDTPRHRAQSWTPTQPWNQLHGRFQVSPGCPPPYASRNAPVCRRLPWSTSFGNQSTRLHYIPFIGYTLHPIYRLRCSHRPYKIRGVRSGSFRPARTRCTSVYGNNSKST